MLLFSLSRLFAANTPVRITARVSTRHVRTRSTVVAHGMAFTFPHVRARRRLVGLLRLLPRPRTAPFRRFRDSLLASLLFLATATFATRSGAAAHLRLLLLLARLARALALTHRRVLGHDRGTTREKWSTMFRSNYEWRLRRLAV